MLADALLRAPRDVPAYLRHLPCWGRRPADLQLPWFSYGAIRFLDRWLRRSHRVFEFGSGGSTFFFAHRAGQVLSVENDAQWHALVSQLLARRSLANATVELHPLADDHAATFRRSTFAQRIRAGLWDLIAIDCHCGFQAATYGVIRPAALDLAMEQLGPGGIIVLDDSWMYPELLAPRSGWKVIDYRGCGPARYGVTSTAIFERT